MKVRIVTYKGKKCLEADGKIIDALAFKSFRPTWKNVGEFYRAGVRLFHVYCSGLASGLKVPYSLFGETWFDDEVYDFTNLDRQIEFFRQNAPEGMAFVNVHLDSRPWYLQKHEGTVNSFTHLSQIAADEHWRRVTGAYLKALIRHTEEKYGDFVCGYFLLGGFTTEWFSQFDHEESHPTKLAAYRAYLNDPAAEIPTKEQLEKPKNQIFLDPEKDKAVITYRKFHNHLIADTVLYYAARAQEVLRHEKPVGVFFGYILELLDERMWDAGHIEFDRINRSGDIDILATPSSYQFRRFDDAGAYMLLCDTLALDDKMCWISFDHTTYLLKNLPDNPDRVCGDSDTDEALKLLISMRRPDDMLKSREQTIFAMRREFMQCLTKRVGLWWFDMLEGWFYDPALMEEVTRQVALSHRLLEREKASASEIAVFVSGESLYHVNKCSGINTELICNQRDALARMGAPYDIFSQNDLTRIDPDRYRVWIFLDAFLLTEEQETFIQTRLKSGGRTLLFCGAGEEKLCGMKLTPCTMPENTVHAFDSRYGYKEEKEPLWAVDDETVEVLGRFGNSRACALARKTGEGYSVVCSALGNLSHAVLHEIIKCAGVHIYVKNGVALYAAKDMAGVYQTDAEETVLYVENGVYEEVFTGTRYAVTDGQVVLPTGENPAQMLIKAYE